MLSPAPRLPRASARALSFAVLLGFAPAAAATSACGGISSTSTSSPSSSSGSPGSSGSTATSAGTPAEFADGFAHATCDNIGACCQTNALVFNANNCLVAMSGQAQAVFVNAGLAAGATYNPTAALACLAQIEAAVKACDAGPFDPDPLYSGPCASVYSGTKAPGDPCATTADCAPGPTGSEVECIQWSSGTSDQQAGGSLCQVVTAGVLGSSCESLTALPSGGVTTPPPSTFASCALGQLTCGASGTCEALHAPGAPCELDSDCVATAWCQNQTCATKSAAGATCTPLTTGCASGFYCAQASSTCIPQLPAGAPCQQIATGQCSGSCSGTGTCVSASFANAETCGG